jgi:hypothetical protein
MQASVGMISACALPQRGQVIVDRSTISTSRPAYA